MSSVSVSFNAGPSAADQLFVVARALHQQIIRTTGQANVVLIDLARDVPDLAEHTAKNVERLTAVRDLTLITAEDIEAIARACQRLGI